MWKNLLLQDSVLALVHSSNLPLIESLSYVNIDGFSLHFILLSYLFDVYVQNFLFFLLTLAAIVFYQKPIRGWNV